MKLRITLVRVKCVLLRGGVKNGHGDVIYRHGCQITGSSCGWRGGRALAVFPLVPRCSTAKCGGCALSCSRVERVSAAGCFPLHSRPRELHHSLRTHFVFCLLLLVLPLPPPSAHRRSINLGCLSDPERSHCAWLKLLPALQITAIEDTYTFFVLKLPLTLSDSLSLSLLLVLCPPKLAAARLTWFNKIPCCHVLYCFCQRLLLTF